MQRWPYTKGGNVDDSHDNEKRVVQRWSVHDSTVHDSTVYDSTVYGAHAVTWESRAVDCHDTDHAASLCPVPQPGTHFQQPFTVTCHYHPASVAVWKLNYLAGPMAATSTFLIATCC